MSSMFQWSTYPTISISTTTLTKPLCCLLLLQVIRRFSNFSPAVNHLETFWYHTDARAFVVCSLTFSPDRALLHSSFPPFFCCFRFWALLPSYVLTIGTCTGWCEEIGIITILIPLFNALYGVLSHLLSVHFTSFNSLSFKSHNLYKFCIMFPTHLTQVDLVAGGLLAEQSAVQFLLLLAAYESFEAVGQTTATISLKVGVTIKI